MSNSNKAFQKSNPTQELADLEAGAKLVGGDISTQNLIGTTNAK